MRGAWLTPRTLDVRTFVPLLLVLGLGCEGLVINPPARPYRDRDDIVPGVVQPAPQTRAARLTHLQWENSVQDLFGLDAPLGLASSFQTDALPGGAIFDNPGGSLLVDDGLWTNYRDAAASAAATVTGDSTVMARIDPSSDAATFIRDFGALAHRRPLTDAETTEYMTVYAAAAGNYGTGVDDHTAGVRLVIEAMLQSPQFLYRVEQSRERSDGTIPLDSYEIASRLSYALWNSMPDRPLFAAAEAGELTDPENVRAHARRMLEDPRADAMMVHYHRQLFEVDEYSGIAPDPATFPNASSQLGAHAATEHDMFVVEIAMRREGTYADLLTSPDTFVNQELADIYGLEGSFDDAFQPVSLDPAQRAGIFTQVGFLANNATSRNPDPIHRGVFVAEQIACVHIEAPPDDVPPVPVIPGATNREMVAMHTEQPGSICAGCHAQIINPFGFPFESYDAVGAWRDEDNGQAVRTDAAPPIDGAATQVAGARDLAHALAESQWTHECYVRHWVEYALGRPAAAEDQALVTDLGARSAAGELTIRELVVELVSSKAFLHRSTREEY